MSVVELERPDLLHVTPLKPLAGWVGRSLLRRGEEAAAMSDSQPNIAVIVRTKNDRAGLARILDHVDREQRDYNGRIDVVVVDTESRDGTPQLAKEFGAKVVHMTQKTFTYPRSVNLGLQAVSPDVGASFITVGHAQPALSNSLAAGARHFENERVAGVFSVNLPSESGNWLNQLSVNYFGFALKKTAHPIDMFYPGALANTGSMIRMDLWRERPYNDAYAGGGEDQDWGKWALAEGHELIYEPAMAVHHGHPLNLLNDWRQRQHWKEVYINPTQFDQEALSRRRPDLFQ